MGCVLQPGEVNAVAALQPGQTTSDAVQPGQDIDNCGAPAPPPGNIALSAVFNADAPAFVGYGFRLTPGGSFDWTNDGGVFWNENGFGTEWVDDGGVSNAQFEARVENLNCISANGFVFTGWSGFAPSFTAWLPITETLQMHDYQADGGSGDQIIAELYVREIAVPGNIVQCNIQLYTAP